MINKKKIVIFHIFPDDKFFDGTAAFYDSLANVENRYCFFVKDKNYKFKYIKKIEKVKVVTNILRYFVEIRSKDLDIVLFHSLKVNQFVLTQLLRKSVKVVWWSWGNDIYMGRYNVKALIDLPLYKPLTFNYMKSHMQLDSSLFSTIKAPFYKWMRKKAVRRVDYFIPTIPIDYKLMKENCFFFNAKLFPHGLYRHDYSFNYKNKCGDLLVGNSLTYTNNHLDIFEKLYGIDLRNGMKIVVPVSYGNGYGGADNIIKMTHFHENIVMWLKDFLSRDKYFEIFNNISHAVFGMVRQQGMGNIFYCLRTGVKVYVYKDSVIARQLREYGYIFFTIEDDLNELSLAECLSKEDAKTNFNIYMKRYEGSQLSDVKNYIEVITHRAC